MTSDLKKRQEMVSEKFRELADLIMEPDLKIGFVCAFVREGETQAYKMTNGGQQLEMRLAVELVEFVNNNPQFNK